MKKEKLPKPVVVSLRKAEIFKRRADEDESSSEIAHALIEEADPGLSETIEEKRKFLREQE